MMKVWVRMELNYPVEPLETRILHQKNPAQKLILIQVSMERIMNCLQI